MEQEAPRTENGHEQPQNQERVSKKYSTRPDRYNDPHIDVLWTEAFLKPARLIRGLHRDLSSTDTLRSSKTDNHKDKGFEGAATAKSALPKESDGPPNATAICEEEKEETMIDQEESRERNEMTYDLASDSSEERVRERDAMNKDDDNSNSESEGQEFKRRVTNRDEKQEGKRNGEVAEFKREEEEVLEDDREEREYRSPNRSDSLKRNPRYDRKRKRTDNFHSNKRSRREERNIPDAGFYDRRLSERIDHGHSDKREQRGGKERDAYVRSTNRRKIRYKDGLPYKMRACWYITSRGYCPNGDACRFIHPGEVFYERKRLS